MSVREAAVWRLIVRVEQPRIVFKKIAAQLILSVCGVLPQNVLHEPALLGREKALAPPPAARALDQAAPAVTKMAAPDHRHPASLYRRRRGVCIRQDSAPAG